MLQQSPAYRQHLTNIQNEVDAKKLKQMQKGNLFNEKSFYQAFTKDMLTAKKEVIIYSPFVSKFRSEFFRRTLTELRKRNIPVFIFTRPLEEHDYFMKAEISCALNDYEESGAYVTYLTGFVHEKLAIIDREILWEGSLNILSQRQSREMMRRISDEAMTQETMSYLGLNKKLAEGYKYQYERLYQNTVKNIKENRTAKIKVFFTGALIPSILWCLFAIPKVIVVLLKGVKLIFSLVGFLFR